MSSDVSIFESKSTYYSITLKKWISGTFTLNNICIQFQVDGDQKEQNLKLPLTTICGLEKKTSTFIYSALVVTVGSEKHWFSSFQSRDTVYNLLELFWRHALLSSSNKKSPPKPKTSNSALGKELLGILYESECTLVDAANALSEQGRQLQESQVEVENINSDLTVAQKLLQSINLKFSTVLPGLITTKSVVEQKDADEDSRQKHFRITFTCTKSNAFCNWEQGTLVVANNFTVLDEHKNNKLTVDFVEVEQIKILTPWEFCLSYSDSWITKEYYIMCPQLSSLLKFLNTFPSMKKKIVFDEDDNVPFLSPASCSGIASKRSTPNSPPPVIALDETFNSQADQMQTSVESSLISDEDMAEISSVLNNLQTLAAEVNREQQDQMEKISALISNVDKTELRINEQNKMIKKAL